MWKEKKVGINFNHHVSGTTQVLHRKAQEGDAARACIQNPAGPHSCPLAHGHVDELCDLVVPWRYLENLPTGLHKDKRNSYTLMLSLQSVVPKLSHCISPSHSDLYDVGGVQVLQLEKLQHR